MIAPDADSADLEPPVAAGASSDAAPRMAAPDPLDDATVAALKHFVVVTAVFGLAWLLPFAHPALDKWRYLEDFDASALVRAVRLQAPPNQLVPPLGPPPGSGQALDDEALAALDPGNAPGAADESGAVGEDPQRGADEAAGGGSDDPAAAGPPADDPALAETPPPEASADETGDGPAAPDRAATVAAPDAGVPGVSVAAASATAVLGSAAAAAPGAQAATATADAGTAPPKAVGVVPSRVVASAALDLSAIEAPAVGLEHPERLKRFYQALADLAHGRRAKVRVRHYGDSHLANDGAASVVRVLMQRRFGDGGHGFVLATSRSRWYVHRGVKTGVTGTWRSRTFIGGGYRDGGYGYGGEAAEASAGATAWVSTVPKGHGAAASEISLWWRGSAGGAELSVERDGVKLAPLRTADTSDTFSTWSGLADGGHRLRLRVVSGRPRFFGWVLERSHGLVWDSLGIVGARARRWRALAPAHLAGAIAARKTDLLVLQYGSNSRLDKIGRDAYVSSFVSTIKRLRPRGDEPCLVVGVSDHGVRERGKIVSEAKTVEMVGWLRDAANDAGCAYFDQWTAMGGEGSMGRWVQQGLGWADYAHLTPKGQATLGRMMYQALMAGLRRHLKGS